ncbi:MAG: type II toxin-antitoxin system RelE/ParE family toxin [Spirochaetales bacterium]|jgi:mRNA interferase RelE/StbE|nr:type II toxin-antitoxin system RelE/ParE family toxin [Spirochaetales bacterium]
MDVVLSRRAANYLKRLEKTRQDRIKAAIENIAKEPAEGDISKLEGRDGYRARVGELRILFQITGNLIKIHGIVPRGQAYNRKEKKKK